MKGDDGERSSHGAKRVGGWCKPDVLCYDFVALEPRGRKLKRVEPLRDCYVSA